VRHAHLLNQSWQQLKFLPVSPLAQLFAPSERLQVATLLARAGTFLSWPSGLRNPDRLPQLGAYLDLPGRGPVSRFCDGTFRAVYGSSVRETCMAELAFHHGQALRDSGEPAGTVRIFEALEFRATGGFVDARKGHPELHRPMDCGPAQAFGRSCRIRREAGILYRSVRHRGGTCLAIFEGSAVTACALQEIVAMRWDGERLA